MTYSIAQAKRQFSELVKRAAYRHETVTVGTRGKPEVALISVEELRRLRELELERDARLLEEAVRRSRGTVGVEDLLSAWKSVAPPGTAAAPPARTRGVAARRPLPKKRRA